MFDDDGLDGLGPTAPAAGAAASAPSARKSVAFKARVHETGHNEKAAEVRYDGARKGLHICGVKSKTTPSKSAAKSAVKHGQYYQVRQCVKVSSLDHDALVMHFRVYVGKRPVTRIVSLRGWPREAQPDVQHLWRALREAADSSVRDAGAAPSSKLDDKVTGSRKRPLPAPPAAEQQVPARRRSEPPQMPRGQGRRMQNAMRQRDGGPTRKSTSAEKGAFASILVGAPPNLTDLAPKRTNVVKAMKARKGNSGREREAARKAQKAKTSVFAQIRQSSLRPYTVPSSGAFGSRAGSAAGVSRNLSSAFDEAAKSTPPRKTDAGPEGKVKSPDRPLSPLDNFFGESLERKPESPERPASPLEKMFHKTPAVGVAEGEPDFDGLATLEKITVKSPVVTEVAPHVNSYSLSRSPDLVPEPLQPLSDESLGTASPGELSGEVMDTGVVNVGNTCYLAAVIQVLLHNKPFIHDLRRRVRTSEYQTPLSCAILELADRQAKGKKLCPKNVQNEIGQIFPMFLSTRQQDAHEFFTKLLDIIADETATRSRSKNTVDKHFALVQEQSVQCLTCGYKSEPRHELYRDLSLDLPASNDSFAVHELTSMLQDYFGQETVELSCEKCDGKEAARIPKVAVAPQMLVLHMKRFKVSSGDLDEFSFEKSKDQVRIPETVSLHEALAAPGTALARPAQAAVVGNKRVGVTHPESPSPRKRPRAMEEKTVQAAGPADAPLRSAEDKGNDVSTDSKEQVAVQKPAQKLTMAQKILRRAVLHRQNAPADNGGNVQYTLHSVIRHCSPEADHGHYVADVAQPDSKWVCFDDTSVTELQGTSLEEQNRECEGYLLFYARQ